MADDNNIMADNYNDDTPEVIYNEVNHDDLLGNGEDADDSLVLDIMPEFVQVDKRDIDSSTCQYVKELMEASMLHISDLLIKLMRKGDLLDYSHYS
jgi:hypothetical protein